MQYILISHGKMASGIKSSVNVLLGERKDLHAIDSYLDDSNPEELLDKIINDQYSNERIVIMTDLYGGSVNRIATKFLSERVSVVAGINLSLVMEILFMDDPSLEEIEISISLCREQMRLITPTSIANNSINIDEDFF